MNNRVLGLLAVVLCLSAMGSAPARAEGADGVPSGPFKPGAYSFRTKGGSLIWHLDFVQDPRVPKRYYETGTWGGIVNVPVSGVYNETTNSLRATARTPGEALLDMDTGAEFCDITGTWAREDEEFFVRPKIYHEGYKLTLTRPCPTRRCRSCISPTW